MSDLALDLWAPDHDVFAAFRRRGDRQAALVVADGKAELATEAELTADGAQLTAPSLELEVQAPTAELLGQVTGTVVRAGKQTPLRGQAVRSAPNGSDAARMRRVFVATDDGQLLQVAAVRPRAGDPHGDELVTAQIAQPQSDNGASSFEDVRLSTIYGADGLPRTAGAELYRPGDEFPARLSGEAVSGAVLDLGDARVAISFFRWTLIGRPGWGTYEIEPAP